MNQTVAGRSAGGERREGNERGKKEFTLGEREEAGGTQK